MGMRSPAFAHTVKSAQSIGNAQAIKYFSFADVPRTFEQAGKVYVLTSEFDDESPDHYEVFVEAGDSWFIAGCLLSEVL
jgi:hypothetical protein